jgi:hypothetical protein
MSFNITIRVEFKTEGRTEVLEQVVHSSNDNPVWYPHNVRQTGRDALAVVTGRAELLYQRSAELSDKGTPLDLVPSDTRTTRR